MRLRSGPILAVIAALIPGNQLHPTRASRTHANWQKKVAKLLNLWYVEAAAEGDYSGRRII